MSTNSRKDFWIMSFIPFSAAMAASGTLIPLFIISTVIGGSVSDIGVFSAISSLVSLPLAFIWGKLTDDTGKRKVFILIMLLSGFGVLLGYTFASDLLWILVLSIISGLLLGSGDTAKTIYIFDHYPPDLWEEKISKYHQLSGLGATLGLAVGGLFQMFLMEYSIFFLICAILCTISAGIGFLTIKDVTKDQFNHKINKSALINADLPVFSSLIQARKIVPYKLTLEKTPMRKNVTFSLILFFLAAFSLFLASNFTFTPLPAFIKQNLGIEESYIFWIFLAYYVISVVGYTFAGNWIDKYGNRKILFTGLLTRGGVYAAFSIFSLFTISLIGSWGAIVGVILLLTFAGLSYSLMNVALQNILPRLIQKNVGEMLAIYSIIVGASSILGSFFSGFIAESIGYSWLFVFSVIGACIAGIIYWQALRKGNIT